MAQHDQGLVELKGVGHLFGHRLVFRQITLRVAPGEILLVLGPNGAGKSTLLQIVAGLLAPGSGDVAWKLEPGEIGYLGHGTCVYPFLSAADNLLFWARMHGLSPSSEEIGEILGRVELKAAALEQAGTFSRGMAQRLSLARVLLLHARLLLLDEPATGLDTASRTILDREITAARDRGAAVIWVSHDAARDVRLADRVLVLRDKRQAFWGAAAGYLEWCDDA